MRQINGTGINPPKKRKYFAPKRQFKAKMLNRESPSISENTKTINLAT